MKTQAQPTIGIGIAENQRKAIAGDLAQLLANTYLLYIKTHNYHWNVTGPQFQSLHSMFENQYQEMASAVDEIAERIRALGVRAPGSYSEFIELGGIKENNKKITAKEMLRDLVRNHEYLIQTIRSYFKKVEASNDQSTADLLTKRLESHEKTTWMLRSSLE